MVTPVRVRIGVLLGYLIQIEAIWRSFMLSPRTDTDEENRRQQLNSLWANQIMKSGLTDDEMEILAAGARIIVGRAKELVSKETLGQEQLTGILRVTAEELLQAAS